MQDKAIPCHAGFLRLRRILAPEGPIPVSKSTWWAGVRDGRFPQPMKLGPRTTVWRAEHIHELLEKGLEWNRNPPKDTRPHTLQARKVEGRS
jgi:predicted DNA-binding transcriptional regulator AlpA